MPLFYDGDGGQLRLNHLPMSIRKFNFVTKVGKLGHYRPSIIGPFTYCDKISVKAGLDCLLVSVGSIPLTERPVGPCHTLPIPRLAEKAAK